MHQLVLCLLLLIVGTSSSSVLANASPIASATTDLAKHAHLHVVKSEVLPLRQPPNETVRHAFDLLDAYRHEVGLHGNMVSLPNRPATNFELDSNKKSQAPNQLFVVPPGEFYEPPAGQLLPSEEKKIQASVEALGTHYVIQLKQPVQVVAIGHTIGPQDAVAPPKSYAALCVLVGQEEAVVAIVEIDNYDHEPSTHPATSAMPTNGASR